MGEQGNSEGMLSPYRVLDLTDEKGLLCAKLLGDLGADVIKVEKPGGDISRNSAPFYHDEPDHEKSLFWFAYNVNKRGITLDIESTDGRDTFKRLVKTADMVVESFPPGYMDKLGLGYNELEKLNPAVIMVSITPFGQNGPYRDYRASDIVLWALGGYMYVYGDADRSPVRVSHHSQAYLHASSAAAAGAMIALTHRQKTGKGQHVDTSIQECVAFCLEHIWAYWDMAKVISLRGGVSPKPRLPFKWQCEDGFVIWAFWGGSNADRLMKPLVDWMDKEGLATDYIKTFDWPGYNFNDAQQEVIDKIAEPARKFFLRHTKQELYKGALERRLQLFPIGTVKDICQDIQLKARDYWVNLQHPELGGAITYPGPFIKATETPPVLKRRASQVGEHNKEIFRELEQRERRMQAPEIKNTDYASQTTPLQGVRIVEFSSALAVPLIGKIFGAFGAESIKVESTTRLELMRAIYPFKDDIQGPDRAGRWLLDNTNKLSMTIDIRKPAGRELAKKLVSKADIVTENFAGGVMNRLGLGYDDLKKVKPDIIMLSSCMQGQTGPHSGYPGYGMQLTALAGMDAITGWPDREPQELGVYTDFLAPQLSMIALLSALDYRRRTGKGQYFDLSQYEVAVQFLAPLVLDYNINGREANREGNKIASAAPHGAYRCLGNDRWCAIGVFTDVEWQNFCDVTRNGTWTEDTKFATLSGRKANEDELNKLVEAWTITKKAEEVMELLQKVGVSAGLVATAQDVIDNDPHLRERQFIVEIEHPEVKKYRGIRPHFVLSKAPTTIRRAPLLGEHNEYVLKQIIGLSDEEIAQLLIERVIE